MGIVIIVNLIFMIFFFMIAYMAIKYFLNQIEKYPRVTLEDIYNSKKERQKYNIEHKINPLDYGFNYKELEYYSKKIKLFGWFIENPESKKALIISHGRGANRLAVLQCLELVKDLNLDKEYSVFLPDLRNSGRSDVSKTFMGYGFGIDIFNTMEMLHEKYGKTDFILYGFSQGGMGSAIAAKLFNDRIRKRGMKVEKLILDSPIANSKKRIKSDASKRKVPKLITSIVTRVFDIRVHKNLHKMRLSYLLRRIPTLLLQSKQDRATTYGMLMEEYNEIAQNKNVNLKVFENSGHVKIYGDNKAEYTEAVKNFLENVNNEEQIK